MTEVDPLSAGIASRLRSIEERVRRAGGDPARLEIVGASKGQPVEACAAALALGVGALGENRVQEALPKMEALPKARWHLIGHLQSNKVRQVGVSFQLIQSLDSVALARLLAKRCGKEQKVLLEVNVARLQGRPGALPEEVPELARVADQELSLEGFMAVADPAAPAAPQFAFLRQLKEQTEERLGRRLRTLSMGMSSDLEAAVAEGSTMLRLGTALFGERPSGGVGASPTRQRTL